MMTLINGGGIHAMTQCCFQESGYVKRDRVNIFLQTHVNPTNERLNLRSAVGRKAREV